MCVRDKPIGLFDSYNLEFKILSSTATRASSLEDSFFSISAYGRAYVLMVKLKKSRPTSLKN